MPIVLKSESLNLLEPSGPVRACNGIALFLPLVNDSTNLEDQTRCMVWTIAGEREPGVIKWAGSCPSAWWRRAAEDTETKEAVEME